MVADADIEKHASESVSKSSSSWRVDAAVGVNDLHAPDDGQVRTDECLEQEAQAAKYAVSALDTAVGLATSFREPATEVLGEAHRALNRLEQAQRSKPASELIAVACEIKCLCQSALTLVKVYGGYDLLYKLFTVVIRSSVIKKFEKIASAFKSLLPRIEEPRIEDQPRIEEPPVPQDTSAAATVEELRQGSHERVHALAYGPEVMPQGHVCIWWSVGKQLEFYSDTGGITSLNLDKTNHIVTSIAIDAFGQIWTGHLKGLVRVRKQQDWGKVIEQRLFNNAVRCIAFDATGCAWMGDEGGHIKVVRCDEVTLESSELNEVAAVYSNEAKLALDELQQGGGMVSMMRAFWPAPTGPEPCEGPVRCILIRDDRVWIGGGRSDPWFGAWHAGEYVQLGSCEDLKAYGVIYCMTQIPWGVGQDALDWSNNKSRWRLLTGHDSGQVLMWDPTAVDDRIWLHKPGHQKLQPVLIIESTAAVRGISYMASCKLILTGHNNGQLVLFSPPTADVTITGSTTNNFAATPTGGAPRDAVIPRVKPRRALVSAHRSAIHFVAYQGSTAVSASVNGTIKLWKVVGLLGEAEKQGVLVSLATRSADAASLALTRSMMLPAPGVEVSMGSHSYLAERSALDNCPLIEFSELQLIKVIGNGAYGRVHLAEWGGTRVAAKEIGANGTQSMSLGPGSATPAGGDSIGGPEHLEVLKNEVHVLFRHNHPNVVRFLAMCEDPPMIVMQYYPHGSLYDLLKKARRGQKATSELTWGKRLEMLHDVAAGMQFLHRRNVVHGDLRSPNLLLDYMVERGQARFHIRIADFGLARMLSPTMHNVAVSKHTNPRWAAPEVIKQSQISRPADVYSFGVVMWELLTWQQPFEDMKSVQVIYSATQLNKRPDVPPDGELPGQPGSTLEEYKHLMQVCWADNADERPSFSRILEAVDHMQKQEAQPAARRATRTQSMERLRELVTPAAGGAADGEGGRHRTSLELLLGSPVAAGRAAAPGAAAAAARVSPFMAAGSGAAFGAAAPSTTGVPVCPAAVGTAQPTSPAWGIPTVPVPVPGADAGRSPAPSPAGSLTGGGFLGGHPTSHTGATTYTGTSPFMQPSPIGMGSPPGVATPPGVASAPTGLSPSNPFRQSTSVGVLSPTNPFRPPPPNTANAAGLSTTEPSQPSSGSPFLLPQPADAAGGATQGRPGTNPFLLAKRDSHESAGSYRSLPADDAPAPKAGSSGSGAAPSQVTGHVTGGSSSGSHPDAAGARSSMVDVTNLLPVLPASASPSSSLTISPHPGTFHPLHAHMPHHAPSASSPAITGASHTLLLAPQLPSRSTSTPPASTLGTAASSLTHWPAAAANPNPFANTRPLIPSPRPGVSTELSPRTPDPLTHSISLPNIASTLGTGASPGSGGAGSGARAPGSGSPALTSPYMRPPASALDVPLIRLDSDPSDAPLTIRQAEQILAAGSSSSSLPPCTSATNGGGGSSGATTPGRQRRPSQPSPGTSTPPRKPLHSHAVADDAVLSVLLSEEPLSIMEAERILSAAAAEEARRGEWQRDGERERGREKEKGSPSPPPTSGAPRSGPSPGRAPAGRPTRTLVSPFAMPAHQDPTL